MASSTAQSHCSWCNFLNNNNNSNKRGLSSCSSFGSLDQSVEFPRAIALAHIAFIQRFGFCVSPSRLPWKLRCEAVKCESAKVSLIELVHQRRRRFQQFQKKQELEDDTAIERSPRLNESLLHAETDPLSRQGELSEEITLWDLNLSKGQMAHELEEAKLLLSDYLKKEHAADTVSLIVSKSTRFLVHLVFLMHWHYHIKYLSRRELTRMEVRGALRFYLESLGADQGGRFTDYILSFSTSLPLQSETFRPPLQTVLTNPPQNTQQYSVQQVKRKRGPKIRQFSDAAHCPSFVYLRSLGMTQEQLATLYRRCPQITQYKVEENMKPVISFCLSLGVQPSEIPGMVLKRPQLLQCSVLTNLQHKIAYLQTLGVEIRRFPRILVYFPHMLTYSQRKISSVANFLLRIGLTPKEVATVLARFPHIVGYSIQQKLDPMTSYLRGIGVDQVSAIIRKSPQTMGLSLEDNVKPTVEFFVRKGFSKEEFSLMIRRFPQILGLNLNKNVQRKWEFFCQMGCPKSDIVNFPQYFGYDLEKRIIPRYKILVKNNLKWGVNKLLSDSETAFLNMAKKAVIEATKRRSRTQMLEAMQEPTIDQLIM